MAEVVCPYIFALALALLTSATNVNVLSRPRQGRANVRYPDRRLTKMKDRLLDLLTRHRQRIDFLMIGETTDALSQLSLFMFR
jgi:hypothetical protein